MREVKGTSRMRNLWLYGKCRMRAIACMPPYARHSKVEVGESKPGGIVSIVKI